MGIMARIRRSNRCVHFCVDFILYLTFFDSFILFSSSVVFVLFSGDSNYRLPLETFELVLPEGTNDDDADCKLKKRRKKSSLLIMKTNTNKIKHCEPGKAKIITQLARLGCGDDVALEAFMEGDEQSLESSLLIMMGATVNQPYPQLPPRYVFLYVQYIYMSFS